jgi:hypothetical protein
MKLVVEMSMELVWMPPRIVVGMMVTILVFLSLYSIHDIFLWHQVNLMNLIALVIWGVGVIFEVGIRGWQSKCVVLVVHYAWI